ncbi:NADAR family protein [bacterium]|nr:NADAR family protein [bacterium]
MNWPEQTRVYHRGRCAVFRKTAEEYGGLSNMASGFKLYVNGVEILSSEALYQACRFPHNPEVQKIIIDQKSPMTAKMKSKPYRHLTRPDWERVKIGIMRWCLKVKLAQNWEKFSTILKSTKDRPIVEEKTKIDFWGAKIAEEDTLVGINMLGRLLVELREQMLDKDEKLVRVEPLRIPNFLLFGEPIGIVETSQKPYIEKTNLFSLAKPLGDEE